MSMQQQQTKYIGINDIFNKYKELKTPEDKKN
jgi:hypothetical protein